MLTVLAFSREHLIPGPGLWEGRKQSVKGKGRSPATARRPLWWAGDPGIMGVRQQVLGINTVLAPGQRDEITAALLSQERVLVVERGMALCPAAERIYRWVSGFTGVLCSGLPCDFSPQGGISLP